MQLQTPPRERAVNPARERGLKRARRYRAPCEPAQRTPMPAPVDAVHLLALLTRVRQARIDAGEIKTPQGKRGQTSRLYDIRAFKTALAELGYLRRLAAAGRTGGTVVTSMAQLVGGLAALHPAWKLDGDKFGDRDRHHRAVRRRLRDLKDMGLLNWRVGVDVDGEDARTELDLRAAPDVSVEELTAAAGQLKRWQARYGSALNTGSMTGIRNAAQHERPLTASERQRRGVAHARARAHNRRGPSTTNSDPHFVASATPQNSLALSSNQQQGSSVCEARTGVTRTRANVTASGCSAVSAAKTAAVRVEGSGPPLAGPSVWDERALLARVAARAALRAPVLEVIAAQAAGRAVQVAGWGSERGWAVGRLREAWVVWRYGAWSAAEHGAALAGPLQAEDPERLRRGVARYERYAVARPAGFPATGLGALAQIARVADEHDARPQTLHYAIRALDQLSRRMRASATADDPIRREHQAARLRRRIGAHKRDPAAGTAAVVFRTRPGLWPAWVALDDAGEPLIVDGELQLTDRPGILGMPGCEDESYLQTLRDAHLLKGLWLPIDADGRTMMAHGDDRDLQDGRRRARPGPYPPPTDRHARPEPEDLELARRAAISLRDAQRVPVKVRDRLLAQHHANDAQHHTRQPPSALATHPRQQHTGRRR